MPIVNFVNEKKQIEVPQGANLRKEARKHDVQVYGHIHKVLNCHGLGLCGTCRVLITKGMEHTNPMTVMERLQFKVPVCSLLNAPPGMCTMAYIGNEDTMRLACQTKVYGDIDVVTKPPLNLFGENFFS
jgi:ferredoxin